MVDKGSARRWGQIQLNSSYLGLAGQIFRYKLVSLYPSESFVETSPNVTELGLVKIAIPTMGIILLSFLSTSGQV